MSDMLVNLYELPELTRYTGPLREKGILIRQALAHEKEHVVSWVKHTFKSAPGWASECDVAFSNHPASCFIATQKGDLLGFACYESTCKNFFGPAGVAEHARQQGIGTALLIACLNRMAAHGYAYAIIGDADSTDFYKKTVKATLIEGSEPGIYRDRLF